jgi:hypothetical protein
MNINDNKASSIKRQTAIIILLAVNITLTVVFAVSVLLPVSRGSDSILAFESADYGQYVLYIGLNDRFTYEQIIPTDEAVDIVNNIFAKHVGGWTMHHARGGWVDETDTLTQENTIVYTLAYADEKAVIAIMNEVLIALNQNSILIERRNLSSVFYRGEVRNE